MELVVHCDGASRGNPGPAAAGVLMLDSDGLIVARVAMRLGVMTNNQAEYHAVLAAMQLTNVVKATSITFRLDSQLTVQQLSGAWRIKNAGLAQLADRIHAAVPPGVEVQYVYVPRALNFGSDRLANWALDHPNPAEWGVETFV